MRLVFIFITLPVFILLVLLVALGDAADCAMSALMEAADKL